MAISRRTFVAQGTVAGTGLVIGVRLSPTKLFAQENEKGPKAKVVNPFDAYIHVKPDGQISLIVAKSEMGQGIKTGLAMLLAEEAEVGSAGAGLQEERVGGEEERAGQGGEPGHAVDLAWSVVDAGHDR